MVSFFVFDFLTLSLYGFCYTLLTQLKGGIMMVIIVGIIALLTLVYLFYELFWGDKK